MYFIRILNAQGDYDYDLETPFAEREEGIKKLKMSTNMEEQCLDFCSKVIKTELRFGISLCFLCIKSKDYGIS